MQIERERQALRRYSRIQTNRLLINTNDSAEEHGPLSDDVVTVLEHSHVIGVPILAHQRRIEPISGRASEWRRRRRVVRWLVVAMRHAIPLEAVACEVDQIRRSSINLLLHARQQDP